MAKKKISSFEINAIQAKTPFNTTLAQKIATEHKFKMPQNDSEKELNNYLKKIANKFNKAITLYYLIKNADEHKPRLSEQKAYIDEISKTTKYLIELLEKMGLDITLRLIRAIPSNNDQSTIDDPFECLQNNLEQLYRRALIANREIPPDMGANPSNPVNSLVWYLANIYEEETHLKAEVKHVSKYAGTQNGKDNYNDNYHGDFLMFLNACTNNMRPNCEIALPSEKTIQDILKHRLKFKEEDNQKP